MQHLFSVDLISVENASISKCKNKAINLTTW